MGNRVAAIQMVSTSSVEENLEAAARLIAAAAREGAGMVVLPEVFAVLEGGPMRDFGEREGQGPIQDFLSAQAREHGLVLVGGTAPLISRPTAEGGEEVVGAKVRAASLVYDAAGDAIARYDKIHLFDVEVADRQANYRESDSYEAGSELVSVSTPLGCLGLFVCYDLRFPELYRQLRSRDVELITVPAAFTRVTGEAHWEVLLRARAIENQCYVIGAAQGGRHNAKRETWGHSMIVDPWGRVLDCLPQGEGLVMADLDLDSLRDIRARMPVQTQRRL